MIFYRNEDFKDLTKPLLLDFILGMNGRSPWGSCIVPKPHLGNRSAQKLPSLHILIINCCYLFSLVFFSDYLCSLDDNIYGIEFEKLEITNAETGTTFFEITKKSMNPGKIYSC